MMLVTAMGIRRRVAASERRHATPGLVVVYMHIEPPPDVPSQHTVKRSNNYSRSISCTSSARRNGKVPGAHWISYLKV